MIATSEKQIGFVLIQKTKYIFRPLAPVFTCVLYTKIIIHLVGGLAPWHQVNPAFLPWILHFFSILSFTF